MNNNPHYAPENLIDMLLRLLGAKNDRHLSERLGVTASLICKIRKGLVSVSANFLINVQEETGLSLVVIRGQGGDYRKSTSPTAVHPVSPPSELVRELQRLDGVHRPTVARGARAWPGVMTVATGTTVQGK